MEVDVLVQNEDEAYCTYLTKIKYFVERCGQVLEKVIHTKNVEKRYKIEFYTKLSTLSTLIQVDNVDYLCGKKNECFVEN